MVRSSVPGKQFPINTSESNIPPYSNPSFRKAKFPVTQFPNVIKASGRSTRSTLPEKGSTISIDLGGGQLVTGEILDYFIIQDYEYVQVKVGPNIYLRPSGNIQRSE